MGFFITNITKNISNFETICNKYKFLVTYNRLNNTTTFSSLNSNINDVVHLSKRNNSRRKASDITKEALEEYFAQGKTAEEIAKIFNCDKSTIYRHKRNLLGIRRPTINITEDLLKDCINQGKTTTELTEIFCCNPSTINKYKRDLLGIHKPTINITKELLEKYIAQEKTTAELAKIFGCSKSTINKYKRELLGFSYQPPKTNISEEILRIQVEKGMSLPQMAQLNNCSLSTIREHLNTIGLRTQEAERAAQISPSLLQTLVKDGWNCKSIAKKFNITEIQVGKLLKKINLETNHSKFEKMITKQDIIDLYEAGADRNQLAEIFNMPEQIINRILQKLGLNSFKPSPKEVTYEKIEINISKLKKLIKAGYTREQIAKKLDVTPEDIISKINEFNIPFPNDILITDKYNNTFSLNLYNNVEALLQQGFSPNEIAKKLEKPYENIREIITGCDIPVTIQKEKFLTLYKKAMISRFKGEKKVLNLRNYFGITDKEFKKLTDKYRYQLNKIFNEVSAQYKK